MILDFMYPLSDHLGLVMAAYFLIPIVLGLVAFGLPRTKPKVASLLGSITPALVVITAIVITDAGRLGGGNIDIALVILIAIPQYFLALLAGVAFACLRRPDAWQHRYFLSMLSAPIATFVFRVAG